MNANAGRTGNWLWSERMAAQRVPSAFIPVNLRFHFLVPERARNPRKGATSILG